MRPRGKQQITNELVLKLIKNMMLLKEHQLVNQKLKKHSKNCKKLYFIPVGNDSRNEVLQMDELTSFLEHPLDQNLYIPKKFFPAPKEPIRVLISEAGGKIAYNLIYQLCNGNVFGNDQEIILHLQNSRGVLHHKSVGLELTECGFPCFKDIIISSNPEIAFKDVDIVIAIVTFEEISGWGVSGSVVHQVLKSFYLMKYAEDYASKDCKIIFTGPATKTLTIMLSVFSTFIFKVPLENVSCVTCLDATISKAVLGKKLRTTTDKIKNVIIWSNTYPDASNASVRMYPSDDLGLWEKKEISIADAVQDDEWLSKSFGESIYRRVLQPDLLNFGKAVAMATAQHLKVLYNGSKNCDEIHSMGVITPSSQPYGVPEHYGFSYPVEVENGKWRVAQHLRVSVCTQISIMNACNKTLEWHIKNQLIRAAHSVIFNEGKLNQKAQTSRLLLAKDSEDILRIQKWEMKYFVVPNPSEAVEKLVKQDGPLSRKSIFWDDSILPSKNFEGKAQKSLIRFSLDSLRNKKCSLCKKESADD